MLIVKGWLSLMYAETMRIRRVQSKGCAVYELYVILMSASLIIIPVIYSFLMTRAGELPYEKYM